MKSSRCHGRATSDTDYEARLDQFVGRLFRAGAKLIWASSTPPPAQSTYDSNEAIVARNAIAARVMQRHGVLIDDLYAHIAPRGVELQNANDVHFSNPGFEYRGREVELKISGTLPSK